MLLNAANHRKAVGNPLADLGGGVFAVMIGYDAAEETFVFTSMNNFGEVSIFRGKVDCDDVSTWTSEAKMNGKLMRQRFTMKTPNPDLATYTFEIG